MFITLILGGLFLVALMYMTKIVVFTTIVLGGIGCIVVALLIMVSPSPYLLDYLVS